MRVPYGFFRCCIDCEDRHVGCHSKCPKYNADRKEWYKLNSAIRDSERTTRHTSIVYKYQNHRGKYIAKTITVSKG